MVNILNVFDIVTSENYGARVTFQYSDWNVRKAFWSASDDTAVENHLFKTNHTASGYYLAKSWKLPKVISEVIKHHHNVELMNEIFNGDQSELATLMAIEKIAEYVTNEYKTLGGSEESHEWPLIKDRLLDYIGICDLDIEELREKATEAILAGAC